MGFWDWFRSTPAPPTSESDLVYLTKTAKLAGLAMEVSAAAGPVVVLAHFPETLRETREALAAVGYTGETADGPVTPAAVLTRSRPDGPPTLLFALVSQLRPDDPVPDVSPPVPVRVLVAERHFLRTHDDAALQFAAGLGRPPVTFFLALDEPLLRAFAGPWVSDLLRRLGLRETDAVESNLVLRRIRQAQAKYARAEHDEPAASAEEWAARSPVG